MIKLRASKISHKFLSILAKFITAQIFHVTLQRANRGKEFRKPMYMFLDEFQLLITESVERILAESRKYALYLTMAHQNLAQLESRKLKSIIFSNTGTKFIGKNAHDTLNPLAQTTGIAYEKLQELQRMEFYASITGRESFLFQLSKELWKEAYQVSEAEKQRLITEILHSSLYREKFIGEGKTSIAPQETAEESKILENKKKPSPKFKFD